MNTISHATFSIEKKYPVSVAKVFAALSDPAKKKRWFGNAKSPLRFEMDFRVGGFERSSFAMPPEAPFPKGTMVHNETLYMDIVENVRIVFAYSMSINDHRMSASLGSFVLKASGKETVLVYTEQGSYFEESDGKDRRQEGWQVLLNSLGEELARG